MKKIILSLCVILIIGTIGFFWANQQKQSVPAPTRQTTSRTISLTAKRIFSQLPVWKPNVSWGEPERTQQATTNGEVAGIALLGTLMTPTASLLPFENQSYLTHLGFSADPMLAAGGPGSTQWGYKKVIDDKTQLIIFAAKTDPTSSKPHEPLQFNCPCKTTVSVFVSDPF